MRRRRAATHRIRSQLTDETGQPITFATPRGWSCHAGSPGASFIVECCPYRHPG